MSPTLLLDLDGTLVDSVPDLAAALNRLMTARGLAPFADAEVAAMVGDGAGALVRRAMAARGAEPDREPDQDALRNFLEDYGAHTAVLTKPYPGVVPTLRALAAEGWRLAVCTNKPEAPARRLLAELGMLELFAAVGGGDTVPARKPDPAHPLATLRRAGGAPGAAVVVGDHRNDVLAAAGAGLPCIFAAWGYGPPEMAQGARATAGRFEEVPALARDLLREALRG